MAGESHTLPGVDFRNHVTTNPRRDGDSLLYPLDGSLSDPVSLAKSDEQQVLKQWEGLGYYSRARTLYKTAGIIMQKWNGILSE